jgi:D-alanine-D-alanine ligase-like ATP-grasp enzyme
MKTRVAVLRGGPSSEYDVSLKSGQTVLSALRKLEEKYQVHDVLIDKQGIWYLAGLPIKPESLAYTVDVVFNALHGEYGEDGTVQKIFENIHLPFTGSGSGAATNPASKSPSR